MSKVHQITSATRSQTEQIHARIVRYSWTMGVRTVFFVLAAVLHNWWSLLFIALSVVLPWIAVIYANSSAERHVVPATYIEDRALPPTKEGHRDD
ncbi:MAG TPA: DUF3099 domain-containing protein [Beutenbergiaceae bacterium]|nr:DUF3099 domain-containing protein [Beutenbergiaceae bacterium]